MAFAALNNTWGQATPTLIFQRDAGLTIAGSRGIAVTVESTSDLAHPNWVAATTLTLSSNSITHLGLLPSANGNRFFRVQPPPVPNPAPDKLVWIPPGTFTKGSPPDEGYRDNDESPQTVVVFLQGLYISKCLLTQEEYAAVIGHNPSWFLGDSNRPVEQVSWHDATNFCFLFSQRELQAGRLPPGWAYRLPTESEWEYACRAGTTTRFSFGDDPDLTLIDSYAWHFGNSGGKPPLYDGGASHPVGTKLPNPWGLYDMHGNLCEWCLDGYGPYPGGSVINAASPASGSRPVPVFRGGSWAWEAGNCRSANRGYNWSTLVNRGLGFRIVLAQTQP